MLYQIENWHITRDRVIEELGINLQRMRFGVDDFYIPGLEMIKVPDFEELSDSELFEKLKSLYPMRGTLCVVVHICYQEGFGPILLDADNLEVLVKNFSNIFSEHFFDTNVIIISLSEKIVWMFHHSGFVGLFDYNS